MGLYPKGSPKWDNNFCKADADETEERKRAAEGVEVPEWDPVVGVIIHSSSSSIALLFADKLVASLNSLA